MNLWVKRTGQLLIAVLFLMSCEDETYLLGFKKNQKFNVGYQEFLVGENSSIIAIDSVITDNADQTATVRMLMGDYNDPTLGKVRCESFAEFISSSTTKLATSATLVYHYDSINFQLYLDNYFYGLVGTGESFTIHRITEDTLSYLKQSESSGAVVFKRYYTNSSIGYDPTPLAEVSEYTKISIEKKTVEVREPIDLSIDRLEEAKDTIVAAVRLPDSFGQELFNVALNDDGQEFSDHKKFRTRFKGLAFVPSQSYSVLGFNPRSTYSKVRLHYHTTENGAVKDTLYRDFFFGSAYNNSKRIGVTFHNIQINRPAELPTPDQPYSGVSPASGLRAVELGNLMITKIDLNSFYTQFADTIDTQIIVNSANFVIESVNAEDAYPPIPNLELRVMKENDRYMDHRNDADSAAMSPYFNPYGITHGVTTDNRYYYVYDDNNFQNSTGFASHLSFNSSQSKYSGSATFFTQILFDNRDKPEESRLRYLGIYPASAKTGLEKIPAQGKSISRALFNKNSIKLRVYYTFPNKPNL